jgi:uncharacterized protein
MDWKKIVDKYYPEDNELKHILLIHSQSVARKALQIVSSHPELRADSGFIEEASMLHDIGIVRCDAPGIQCFGTEPYIRHGVEGAEMLRALGFERHARVCERHTGAGLSLRNIEEQDLPLPHVDLLPETVEEKIICYADKFYSKTHLERERTVEQALASLVKHGADGVARFEQWITMFE